MDKSGDHGALAENTHRETDLRQIVVFIREKAPGPASDSLAGASALAGGVAGAVENAAAAVENAAASIPGLNMFLKEEKDKSSDADQAAKNKYKYFEDYSSWDKVKKDYNTTLPEMNDQSCTLLYEYNSKDAAGRKQDAQQLHSQIGSKLSGWTGYSTALHFVGLDQGGNIAAECTRLLNEDSSFSGNAKWWLQSVTTIATPQYSSLHRIQAAAFKGRGSALHFGNRNDFTQQAIAFFEPSDKLIEKIKDANKGTLSIFTGKIKMHTIQALACVMKGVGTSGQSPQQLYDGVKGEVEGLVGGVIDIVKQLVGEGIGLFQPGDISQLKNMMNGFDAIPGRSANRLKQFFADLPGRLKREGKKAFGGGDDGQGAQFGPQMLMGMFNCLCPLVDGISDSLALFRYDSPASVEFAGKIIESAGVTQVHVPGAYNVTDLAVEPAMTQGSTVPGQAASMMNKVRQLLITATENKENKATVAVSDMNDKQKQALAEAIFVMATPMLPSKKDFYARLLNIIPLSLNEYLEKADGNVAAQKINTMISGIGLMLPPELQQSLSRNKSEVSRVAGFFNKSNYPVDKGSDTLQYVYQSHNLALQRCYGAIGAALDKQTGVLDHMKSKGYKNTVTQEEQKYELETSSEKSNVRSAPQVN